MGFAFKLEVGMHLALEVPNNYLIFKSLEMLQEETFDILIVRGAAGSWGFQNLPSQTVLAGAGGSEMLGTWGFF